MTNREWLEGLADHELAIFIIRNENCCRKCIYMSHKTNVCSDAQGECTEGIERWLEAEHRESERIRDD